MFGGGIQRRLGVRDGKLVVGFDKAYPPYGFEGDDGEYTGFDLDLAQAVADKLGWEVQLEAIDWDAKDTLLDSGAINCIWNGFTMEGREDDYTFSIYMLNAQVVVVKDSGIASLSILPRRTSSPRPTPLRRASSRGTRPILQPRSPARDDRGLQYRVHAARDRGRRRRRLRSLHRAVPARR